MIAPLIARVHSTGHIASSIVIAMARSTRWVGCALVLIALTAPVMAEPASPEPRRWRVLAAAMLGMRADQGGLISSGYRFVAIGGIIHPQFSLSFAIDHQLGDDNRIPGASAPARFSEWIASARLGRAFRFGPDFWLQGALGLARVNSRVTRIDSMRSTERGNLAMDAVATIVWRSGLIASTLVFGVTAIPAEEQIVIDGATYIVPERVEPWFGLGIALMF